MTLAAKRSDLGRVYLDWAQYPVVETEQIESGYIVRFQDLRYDYPGQTRRGVLGASVELDRNLNVVREGFGSRGAGARQAVGWCGAGALARVSADKLESTQITVEQRGRGRPRHATLRSNVWLDAALWPGHNHGSRLLR